MDERKLQDFSREIFEENKNSKMVEIYLDGEKFYEIKNFIQVTDRIKTVEDACRELGLPDNKVELKEYMSIDEYAYSLLNIVTKALNEEWIPDWTDLNQNKWFPGFKITRLNNGVISVIPSYAIAHPSFYLGTHFCFKSKELAEYAGTQFKDLYEYFLLY